MINKGLVRGVTIQFQVNPDPICEPCLAGNMRRIVNRSATHNKEPLELIHSDVHGPMNVQSQEGHRYWCVFVDDATRHWSIYFLKTKDQTFEAFKMYKAQGLHGKSNWKKDQGSSR